MSKSETTNFRLKNAEQSCLNHYFGAESVRLLYAHGGDLVIKERSPEMLKAMQSDARIVHYAAVEPTDPESKRPNGVYDQILVYDIKKQEGWVKKAKTKWGGIWLPGWPGGRVFQPGDGGALGPVSHQPVIVSIVRCCNSCLYIEGTPYMLRRYPASLPRGWIVGFI